MRLLPDAMRFCELRFAAFLLAAFLFPVQPSHAECRHSLARRRPSLDGELDGERRKSSSMKLLTAPSLSPRTLKAIAARLELSQISAGSSVSLKIVALCWRRRFSLYGSS
jgi:hypothetical protein